MITTARLPHRSAAASGALAAIPRHSFREQPVPLRFSHAPRRRAPLCFENGRALPAAQLTHLIIENEMPCHETRRLSLEALRSPGPLHSHGSNLRSLLVGPIADCRCHHRVRKPAAARNGSSDVTPQCVITAAPAGHSSGTTEYRFYEGSMTHGAYCTRYCSGTARRRRYATTCNIISAVIRTNYNG